jgi:putative PIN family toxin of toxin-antitoxin system
VPPTSFRLVLDTNILVRAFINPSSDSGRILRACEARLLVPLLSSAVLREYREILGRPQLCLRYPQLNRPEIAVALERLIYVGDHYRRVRVKFDYPRDPKDTHLIELAIAGAATHLISTDDDLLSLPHARTDAGKRFRQRLPNISVAKPDDFLQQYRDELELD